MKTHPSSGVFPEGLIVIARFLLGKSRMCPTDDFTVNDGPRYLPIVFAFAGDSTIRSFLLSIACLSANGTAQSRFHIQNARILPVFAGFCKDFPAGCAIFSRHIRLLSAISRLLKKRTFLFQRAHKTERSSARHPPAAASSAQSAASPAPAAAAPASIGRADGFSRGGTCDTRNLFASTGTA